MKKRKSKREKVVKRGVSLPWRIDYLVSNHSKRLGIGRSAYIAKALGLAIHHSFPDSAYVGNQSLAGLTPQQNPQTPTPAG